MNRRSTLFLGVLSLLTLSLFIAPNVQAHVVVTPKQANVATYQDFTISVPTEESVPTTSVKLEIPDGVTSVVPNAKPGWQINLTKDGTGDDAKVTEIVWSGGTIPVDQRDEFVFNAQLPANATTVNWKAYQTYQDGTVISWDADPSTMSSDDSDSSNKGPYSQTQVIDDLSNTSTANTTNTTTETSENVKVGIAVSIVLGIVALVIALLAYQKTNKK